MSQNSGRYASILAVALLFYLFSPPLVYKASQVTGIPMSEKVFVIIYAPLIPLVQNVKAYGWLMQTEAVFLRID